MKILNSLVMFLLLTAPACWAAEGEILKVNLPAGQVATSQELGTLKVEGVGVVKISARREGTLMVIQAVGPEKNVIGRAESVVGLRETPVYITTSKGLKKLTVVWQGP